jgi:hypothetical protein
LGRTEKRRNNPGVTSSLPTEVQQVFDRFITTEFTTVDSRGAPITWPVTPYYRPGDPCIDLTTGLGYPKKANDARANPNVSLLFSDPTGSGLDDAPMVLVQGTADVDDRDLDHNRERYAKEAVEKLPGTRGMLPPKALRGPFRWYFTRIYVHVRPERVYVWNDGPFGEPALWDALMEEVRSGHDEVPDAPHEEPEGGESRWDERIDELGELYDTAVLSLVAPDGFPFSLRVPVRPDRQARRIRIEGEPVGVPLQPGLACITAHDHHPDFKWQRNFQVRGDLVRDESGWSLLPHKLVGGFELPPGGLVTKYRYNIAKGMRFRRTAKRELAKREARR